MALTADAPLASASRAAASAPTLGQVLRGMIALGAQRAAKWREYRRVLNELQALDDRTLADMSLHRSSLRGVAREAAGLK